MRVSAASPTDTATHAGAEGTAERERDYRDTWVVMPTYNEADNIVAISRAVLERLPGATLLVVDDASPDGTGRLADEMARADPHVRVHHRPGKQGLGKAYIDGYRIALDAGAVRVAQLDADWSHDPVYLPTLIAQLAGGPGTVHPGGADMAIGSR